jgi:catechol 2,3-dioxygenase-like lactoylglutathione lyase family enzyme
MSAPPAAHGFVHHLDLTVLDLARSTQFYDSVLPLLGFERIADCAEGPLWRGQSCELGLQAARGAGRQRTHDRYSPGLHHLALGAPSRDAVDQVYRALCDFAVPILDPPAEYPAYGPGYYAVFFSDPDRLKLEYVFTPPWPAS